MSALESVKASAPMGKHAYEIYKDLSENKGLGNKDFGVIFDVLRKL
jgi:3-hydroxyisobutyrate dehydrogenase-like beta-hydroxyacid dehydrogenase